VGLYQRGHAWGGRRDAAVHTASLAVAGRLHQAFAGAARRSRKPRVEVFDRLAPLLGADGVGRWPARRAY
jgi:hypothetical protein